MRKNMALSKIQHQRILLRIHNQAYNMCKPGTTFRENRNPTPMKSSTCTDEARFTVQVGFGTWKRSYGLRRMRWKGLAKATLQVRLTALAYNLKRTMTILTVAVSYTH